MKYGYYPGCSLERNAGAYQESTLAIADPLGIELAEIDDQLPAQLVDERRARLHRRERTLCAFGQLHQRL